MKTTIVSWGHIYRDNGKENGNYYADLDDLHPKCA